MTACDEELSKTLSYALRHRPDVFGLELDEGGWVSLQAVVTALCAAGRTVTRADIERVVQTNDKQRFAISEDGSDIRANQGHSRRVNLGYQRAVPPARLYHGTVHRFVAPIRLLGLRKHQREHVHLSPSLDTALAVGARRGKPLVLEIEALRMHEAGHWFFHSVNGVWLTDHVPARYIRFPKE